MFYSSNIFQPILFSDWVTKKIKEIFFHRKILSELLIKGCYLKTSLQMLKVKKYFHSNPVN